MFKEIIEILSREGYESEQVEVIKGGTNVHGIRIKTETNINPVYYPEMFPGKADEKAKLIIDLFKETGRPNIDVTFIYDWETVKDKIKLAVRPKTEDNSIKCEFLDLEITVKIRFEFENNVGTIAITEEMLKLWGKTKEEVFEQARANADSYLVEPLFNAIPEELKPRFEPLIDNNFYLMTNTVRSYGASILLQPKIFDNLAHELGSDLIIIPSSIHEVICIRADIADEEVINQMIKEVNTNDLLPQEVLSDHLYKYSRFTKTISY